MTETEEVWYSGNSGSKRYHTHQDCRYVNDRHNTRRREVLDAWGFDHCEVCEKQSAINE